MTTLDTYFYWTGFVVNMLIALGVIAFILFMIWERLPKRLSVFFINLFTFPSAIWFRIGTGKGLKLQQEILEEKSKSQHWEVRLFAKWWKWWMGMRIKKGWTRVKKEVKP